MSSKQGDLFALGAPTVRPEVDLVDDLFDEIDAGQIRVPRFQRPFVWKPQDMLALFDSIYRGYPIGNLLLWNTDITVDTLDTIGPLKVPDAQERAPVTLVLDGQQRLSTLYGALRNAVLTELQSPENWRWAIFFDLRRREFVHLPSQNPEPHHLPMRSILRTIDFLAYSRRVQELVSGEAESLIVEAERIVQKVKSYKFAITRIQGGSLTEAVEIFSRLNTTGRPMTPDEMLSALTYRQGKTSFHLANRIDRILEQLAPLGFGAISRTFIFRSIIAATQRNILTTDWAKLAKELGDSISGFVDAAEVGLLSAARFLADELGVVSDRLLPYSYQLVLLAEFFRCSPKASVETAAILRNWFWVTSFSGWFAGANSTQLEDALQDFRRLARGGTNALEMLERPQTFRGFPITFDMRSARVRALFLSLWTETKPCDLEGKAVPIRRLLETRGARAFVTVFADAHESVVSEPANRLFFEPRFGRSLLAAIQDEGVSPTFLTSHFIHGDALVALRDGDAEEFILKRTLAMKSAEKAALASLGFNRSETDSAGDIDTE